jgi:hypothetical protein
MFNFLSSLVKLMIMLVVLIGVLAVLNVVSPNGVISEFLNKVFSLF